MDFSELQNILSGKIPISNALGATVLQLNEDSLLLKLPLFQNQNHKKTLFGGSLYAGSALACYGLFLAGLAGEGMKTQNIVIAEGTIKYLRPVESDATVEARWPSDTEKHDFFRTLQNKGKARLTVGATIICDKLICCRFTGHFVARL